MELWIFALHLYWYLSYMRDLLVAVEWEVRKHCSASLWNTWLWELDVCYKVIQRDIIISDLACHACSKLICSPMSRKWQGIFPTGQALWNSLLRCLKEVYFLEVCGNHHCRVQRCLRLLLTLFQQYLPLACGPVVQCQACGVAVLWSFLECTPQGDSHPWEKRTLWSLQYHFPSTCEMWLAAELSLLVSVSGLKRRRRLEIKAEVKKF